MGSVTDEELAQAIVDAVGPTDETTLRWTSEFMRVGEFGLAATTALDYVLENHLTIEPALVQKAVELWPFDMGSDSARKFLAMI